MEHKPIESTSYCLLSHNLKVETGRWGSIERENRLWSCSISGIQDEFHVLFQCALTRDLRQKYQIQTDSFDDIYNEEEDETLCDIFYELSKIFAK